MTQDNRGYAIDIQEHALEVWLSFAMTMYGTACLLKRRFTGVNCFILFTLWFVQFICPPDSKLVPFDMRKATMWIFAALTPIELIVSWRYLHPLEDLIEIRRLMNGSAAVAASSEPRSTPGTGGGPGSTPT
jgi:hypothetical protein